MRQQNIVLFSSGVSESNGILDYMKNELKLRGCNVSYWRDLSQNARDLQNIALLPILVKKIPTFDFALLICEGHDITMMRRKGEIQQVATMRDNVLFEIGLCTMALGPERTILLTDGHVRLPEDLQGINMQTAVKVVTYSPEDVAGYTEVAAKITEYIQEKSPKTVKVAAEMIHDYILGASQSLSPTVIGASVSTANGYVSNFVLRTLEKADTGIQLMENPEGQLSFFDDNKIYMHIVLPQKYSLETPSQSRAMMEKLQRGYVPAARFRRAEFRYRLVEDELHIYDYPTTLVTSYQTARMILRMEADDSADQEAEQRFNAKELDLFETSLHVLLSEPFIREIVTHFSEDDTPEEEECLIRRLTAMVERITVERDDY